MTPPINNDINSLSVEFRKRFDPFRKEVLQKYPNAVVFECRRSQERQNWLYAQGRTRPWKIVTWTLNSNHKDWNAVDIVFRNNGKLEWIWPYNDLIAIAKKYWIMNLKPVETCHFQLDSSVKYPTESKTPPILQKPTTAPADLEGVSPEDIININALIRDKIFDWHFDENFTKRTGIIIWRLYNIICNLPKTK